MTNPSDDPFVAEGEAADEKVTGRDAGPVDDAEAQAAAEGLTVSDADAANYDEALKRGANTEGEGKFA